MIGATSSHAAQCRLAQLYLTRLQHANAAIRRDHANRSYWLKLVEQDWDQIKHWQAWAASGAIRDGERARLCAAFPTSTADVLRARQTPSEHLTWVQQALAAANTLGDGEAERSLLYQLGMAYFNLEWFDQTDHAARQLMDLARAAHDEFSLGRAWFLLGYSHLLRGMYDAAEEYLKKSIEILVAHHADDETARTWRGFGRIALYRGDCQQAYEYHKRYLDLVHVSGNARELGAAYIALTGVFICLRDFRSAQRHAAGALEIARSNGFQRMVPPALLSLADAERELEDLDNACLHYEEGITVARSISPPSTIVGGLYGLGRTRFLQGETDTALMHFEEALKLSLDAGLPFRVCEVAYDMVFLHLARNELELAYARLRDLASTARQVDTPHFKAMALAAAIWVWQRRGSYEQAAIWAGLLSNYTQNLLPVTFDFTICEQLEQALGPKDWQRALRKGKKLSLDSAAPAILSAL